VVKMVALVFLFIVPILNWLNPHMHDLSFSSSRPSDPLEIDANNVDVKYCRSARALITSYNIKERPVQHN